MSSATDDQVISRLLRRAGTTYAEEAGIGLKDKPMPLFQLLTMAMLASKPIDATIAARASRELSRSGLRTATAVLDADRSTMIHAFARAHYVRYDESSATRLIEIATAVRDDYDGDLRNLAVDSRRDIGKAESLLQEFSGIGETGASIFLREVQDVWTWVRPYFDERALEAARRLGLPATPDGLSELAPRSSSRVAAALVRVSLDDGLRKAIVT